MKRIALAIDSTSGLDGAIAPHFGRCAEFVLVDVDEKANIIAEQKINNPLHGHHGGACEIPGYIKQYNIQTMIAGGMGARAIGHFNNFGIEVVSGIYGWARDVLAGYLAGEIAGVIECKDHRGGE